jgi:arsenite-transporting ATPase
MLEGASGGGLDELTAALLLVETLAPETSAGPPDLVVVDLPSTGQALRLIDAPAGAQEWAKGLLALLLKYREVTGLGDAARDLLELSRGLGRLRRLLQDPARTRIVVVTRPAELPALQTGRLLGRLGRRGLPRAALLVNAVTPPGCGRCARAAREEARRIAALRSSRASGRCAMILAPATAPAPRGPARLEAWSRGWRPAAHLSDEPCASRSSTASSGARRRRP